MKLRLSTVPFEARRDTVQVVVPEGSPTAATVGWIVMLVALLTSTLPFQLLSPLFQVALPLVAPLQTKLTRLTLSNPRPPSVKAFSQGALVHEVELGEMLVNLTTSVIEDVCAM
ncbi:MAG TPA: hypothetical protein VEC19_09490 [Usitatibacter sp.]|nr:hypothetical protein [Usitatibacter sp.]